MLWGFLVFHKGNELVILADPPLHRLCLVLRRLAARQKTRREETENFARTCWLATRLRRTIDPGSSSDPGLDDPLVTAVHLARVATLTRAPPKAGRLRQTIGPGSLTKQARLARWAIGQSTAKMWHMQASRTENTRTENSRGRATGYHGEAIA